MKEERGTKLKSRQKKHLDRIIKRSPIFAFSTEGEFSKGEHLTEKDILRFNEKARFLLEDTNERSFIQKKKQLLSNLYLFADEYLNWSCHPWVYVLIPVERGGYKVVEKENKYEWKERYWKKEDPSEERDWRYYDEDTNELFDYMMRRFMKHQR